MSLLVVIDPAARSTDGEAVRIARDVLGAGAAAKICVPDDAAEAERALARRGSKLPVVVGDDAALVRAARALHRAGELADCALAVIPVGPRRTTSLAGGLGVPLDTVAAARAVLDGEPVGQGLLLDEDGGLVLGSLAMPAVPSPAPGPSNGAATPADERAAATWWARPLRGCGSLLRPAARRPLSTPRVPRPSVPQPRLHVEADGVELAGSGPAAEVRIASTDVAEVVVHEADGRALRRVEARKVIKVAAGADFRYRADAVLAGPVRAREWAVRASAWQLTLPRDR
ncbi:diacylglycerol kinase [Streptomyces boninensis]|uniref:diacylglycerol kinase n=1 Tax=Streptomyces boninensis TaxID=2039455 RepID=UPI003B20CE13